MSHPDLSDTLLRILDEPTASAAARLASLPSLLADGLATGRRTWPGVAIGDHRFVEQVAATLAAPADVGDLPSLSLSELFLVAACADGDPVAIESLIRVYRPSIEAALRRLPLNGTDIDDVLQRLWEHLLVGAPDGRPHIADYRGRGALRRWLRASAVRIAFRLLERAGREVTVDEDDLADLASGEGTAEVAYLKQRYAAEFRQAFEAALAALSPRQRALLRRHYLDGLTGDQLGALYGGVHRTTATRWLAEARQCVLEHTQRELRERLQIGEAEVASLLHLVASQLDVSLERILASGGRAHH